jgi:hypothetical protein
MPSRPKTLLLLALAATTPLAGCGGDRVRPDPMLAAETFDADETFSRTYAVPPEVACEAARRALLGQGYVVAASSPSAVTATKNFQPSEDDHTQIEVRTSCAPRRDGGSLVFVSALRDRYALKKSATSASLGVGALGSVSLPVGSSDDSLVRVASSTVQDAGFYQRFFERVGYYLPADAATPPGGSDTAGDGEDAPQAR